LEQAIGPFLLVIALFIITLAWLFLLIAGRKHFNLNVNAFGVKVEINANKGDTNEQDENS